MRFPNRICSLIAGTVLGLVSHSAMAQTESAGNERSCIVFANEQLGGQLMAACRGKGFVLGPADAYEVIENAGLEATIIDLTWAGERRVLMISFPDGEPLLEDMSGTLAKSAGRGPMSEIDDVTIDFSSFAEDGSIRTALAGPVGGTGEVNIGLQIVAEASRGGSIPEHE